MKAHSREELVERYSIYAFRPTLSDDLWRAFGFTRRPRRGAIFQRWFKDRYVFEERLTSEFVALAAVDLIRAVQNAKGMTLIEREEILCSIVERLWSFAPDGYISLEYLLQRIAALHEISLNDDINLLRKAMIMALSDGIMKHMRGRSIAGVTLVTVRTDGRGFVLDRNILSNELSNAEVGGAIMKVLEPTTAQFIYGCIRRILSTESSRNIQAHM
jgi:hypothetical protein